MVTHWPEWLDLVSINVVMVSFHNCLRVLISQEKFQVYLASNNVEGHTLSIYKLSE